MKTRFLYFLNLGLLFALSSLCAQTPQKMSYQAVLRDGANALLANQSVGMRIAILQNAPNGPEVFAETHSATTNDNGLVTLQIGSGTTLSGNLAAINWASGTYFLKVEWDPNGGTNYSLSHTAQLLSVPYALHARTVEIADDADADPTNEIQTLSKAGNTISLSNGGGSVTDEVNDADADPTNEIQMLSKAGNTISLSNGGGSVTDEVNDADADPSNEIQTLSFNDATNELSISNGNTVTLTDEVNDADADPSNEIQTLSFNDATNELSISKSTTPTLTPPTKSKPSRKPATPSPFPTAEAPSPTKSTTPMLTPPTKSKRSPFPATSSPSPAATPSPYPPARKRSTTSTTASPTPPAHPSSSEKRPA